MSKEMTIKEVLISLYEWGRQSAYGNLQDYTPKRTQKVNQALSQINKIRHRDVPKKIKCKYWGDDKFNEAIDQMHANIDSEEK